MDKDPTDSDHSSAKPPSKPLDDKALATRKDALSKELQQSRGQTEPQIAEESRARQTRETKRGVAQAFRLSSEFIAGVVVGGGIGYAIDQFFGTTPWGLIVFFLLGFAAAILNVLRASGMVAESEMRLKPAQELHSRINDDQTTGIDQKNE